MPKKKVIPPRQRLITAAPYFLAIFTIIGLILNILLLLTHKGRTRWHAAQAIVLQLIFLVISVVLSSIIMGISPLIWLYIPLGTINSLVVFGYVLTVLVIVLYVIIGLKVFSGTDLRITFLESITNRLAGFH